MKPKVTIAIPAFNNEKHIADAIKSALNQNYPHKEILVLDDCSTDATVIVARTFSEARLIINRKNFGIGSNLAYAMEEAKGKYVVYLCADDIFADDNVVSDIVKIFDSMSSVGVIGRYYYYFYDGFDGAIGVCRERNILISSCCPSGMAFRRQDVVGTNRIFIEMPFIVSQYLKKWRWTMIEYDTVAARFHPGGNTGTKKSYYTESPLQNWVDLLGDKSFKDYQSFIMLKNRASHMLWREICLTVKLNKSVLKDWAFYGHVLIALIFPSFLLRRFTNFYRNRISRLSAKIIKRESVDCNGRNDK